MLMAVVFIFLEKKIAFSHSPILLKISLVKIIHDALLHVQDAGRQNDGVFTLLQSKCERLRRVISVICDGCNIRLYLDIKGQTPSGIFKSE